MAKETLKQQAYHIIKDKIISCEYLPNTLLNEEKLREEVHASRTPVRDALSRLEQENLIQILPKKGIMVAPLSIREINMIYEARMLIEPYAVENYGERILGKRLQYFRGMFQGQKQKGSMRAFYEVDNEFHQEFIDATENDYFRNMYERIFNQNCRLRILSGVKSESRIAETKVEHFKIVESFMEKDWGGAAAAMREHLSCSKRASFEAILEKQDMIL
jgi:Transcriptional regulators